MFCKTPPEKLRKFAIDLGQKLRKLAFWPPKMVPPSLEGDTILAPGQLRRRRVRKARWCCRVTATFPLYGLSGSEALWSPGHAQFRGGQTGILTFPLVTPSAGLASDPVSQPCRPPLEHRRWLEESRPGTDMTVRLTRTTDQ